MINPNKHYDATHRVEIDVRNPIFRVALERAEEASGFVPLGGAELEEAEAALQEIRGMTWHDFRVSVRFRCETLVDGNGIAFWLTSKRKWLAERDGDVLRLRGFLSKPCHLMVPQTARKKIR